MELFSINPLKIKIKDSLPRFRKDMGDVKDLAKSLKEKGQLQPIVVNRELELIAGGRRLSACLLAGIDVLCVYVDAVDDLVMRELELEENIQRKQFTPAEELEAIAELHNIKQKLYDAEPKVEGKKCHGVRDTATLLGKSVGSVSTALTLSEALKEYPELRNCKTQAEIKKAVEAKERNAARVSKLKDYEASLRTKAAPFELFNMSCVDFLSNIEDGSVDIILTDPPYGIEIDKVAYQIGGKIGGTSVAGFSFDDDTAKALGWYTLLATESYRISKPSSHMFVFVAPEFVGQIRALFTEANWNVWARPIIWIKRVVGQCNQPSKWPVSAYEMLLYARRIDSVLQKQGQVDWIECPPLNPTARRHPTEKPIKLIRNLIQRVAQPGQILVDPFMGSGAIIEAACTELLYAKGCDILVDAYAVACERMTQWSQNQELINLGD